MRVKSIHPTMSQNSYDRCQSLRYRDFVFGNLLVVHVFEHFPCPCVWTLPFCHVHLFCKPCYILYTSCWYTTPRKFQKCWSLAFLTIKNITSPCGSSRFRVKVLQFFNSSDFIENFGNAHIVTIRQLQSENQIHIFQ